MYFRALQNESIREILWQCRALLTRTRKCGHLGSRNVIRGTLIAQKKQEEDGSEGAQSGVVESLEGTLVRIRSTIGEITDILRVYSKRPLTANHEEAV